MSIHLHHDGLSRPLDSPQLRLLSLGVGVQSTTLAFMAARGDVGPMPDAAIFADTQAEPAHVYRYLAWLAPQLPYPVIIASAGDLEADTLAGFNSTGQRYASIPAFVLNEAGKVGITRRQCTKEYKLEPIVAETRRMLGLAKGRSIRHHLKLKRAEPTPRIVEQWIGISTDEIERMARSRTPYIHNRHPLIEARMSRRDCEAYLAERQIRVPKKSACVFCPFKTNAEWLDLQVSEPEDFARAVTVDRAIRNGNPSKGMRATVMALHRSLRPLEEIDFAAEQEDPRFGFANECLGMCGV